MVKRRLKSRLLLRPRTSLRQLVFSCSSVASSAPRRLPQHQSRAVRPCGPSDRLHAGSTRTQPAGPSLFLPCAAALLRPLGQIRCSAARLSSYRSPIEMSQEPGLRSGALCKNVHRRQKGLSSRAGGKLRPYVGVTWAAAAPEQQQRALRSSFFARRQQAHQGLRF